MGNTASIQTGKRQKYYQSNAVGKNSIEDDVSLPSIAVINTPSPRPQSHPDNIGNHHDRPSSRQTQGHNGIANTNMVTMMVERRDPDMDQEMTTHNGPVKESIQRRSIDMGANTESHEGEEVLKRREIRMTANGSPYSKVDAAKFHSMQEIKQYIINNPNLMSGRLKVDKDVHGIEKYKQKPKQVKIKQNTYLDLIHPSLYQSHPPSLNPKLNVGVVYPPTQDQENFMNRRQTPQHQFKIDQQQYLNYVGPKMELYKTRKTTHTPKSEKYETDGNGNLISSREGILKHKPAHKKTAPLALVDNARLGSGTVQSRRSTNTTDGGKSSRRSVLGADSQTPLEVKRGKSSDKKSKRQSNEVDMQGKNGKEKIKDKVVRGRGYSPHTPDDRWSVNSKSSEIASTQSDKDSNNVKPLYFKKTLAFSTAYHGEEMVFNPVESDVLY